MLHHHQKLLNIKLVKSQIILISVYQVIHLVTMNVKAPKEELVSLPLTIYISKYNQSSKLMNQRVWSLLSLIYFFQAKETSFVFAYKSIQV